MTKEKIERINFLARKSKECGLCEEEKREQKLLRDEYIACIRENVKKQLECIRFVEEEEKATKRKH